MTNLSNLNKSTNTKKVDMAGLWKETISNRDFRFDIKAQSVAVDLVRAIEHLGLTQAQVADKLGWKPSRVSRVLHGATNVTLRTLLELAEAIGLEFDVIYRGNDHRRAAQPWETHNMLDEAIAVCRSIDSLHGQAQANLTASEMILDTARRLNRRGWLSAQINVPSESFSMQNSIG